MSVEFRLAFTDEQQLEVQTVQLSLIQNCWTLRIFQVIIYYTSYFDLLKLGT